MSANHASMHSYMGENRAKQKKSNVNCADNFFFIQAKNREIMENSATKSRLGIT